MADDYEIAIRIDAGAARPTIASVTVELGRAEERGARAGAVISKGMREAGLAAEKAKHAVSGVGDSLHELALFVGLEKMVHHAIGLADAYTGVSNRLRVVAADHANLNGLLGATFKIAQDTRQEWDETANMYQRISKATEHLGTSQQQVIDLTKEISQGLALSGANAQESRMTMQELTHAFELGALTGREFKVVLKDATPIIGELAKALGKSRGEFIEMGKHGKVSAAMLMEGFAKAGPSIEAQFNKMVPTIAQSFTVLENAAKKFFGEAGTGSGVLAGLAGAVKFVADHFETFGKVALGVGEALISLYVLEKIIVLVRALGVAVLAHPLFALFAAIVTGIALLRQFGDQLDAGIDGVTKVCDVMGVLWDRFKDLASAIGEFLSGAWSTLVGAFSSGVGAEGIELSLKSVLVFMASFVDAAVSLFRAMKQTLFGVFGGLTVGLGELFVDLARGVVRVVQEMINGIVTALNEVIRIVDSLTSKIDVEGVKRAVKEGQAKGLTGATLEDYALKNGRSQPSTFQIPKVNLDFQNPLAGATDHARDLIRDAWGKDFGTSIARDFVAGFADGVQREAAAKATIRGGINAIHDLFGVGQSYIKTTGEGHGEAKADPAAKKARDALIKELASIERASNPITAAEMKLARAIDVTTRAVHAQILPWNEALEIVLETADATRDARLPYEAWAKTIDEETVALGLSTRERERYNAVFAASEDLRKKGVQIGPDILADIGGKVDQKRLAEDAAKYRDVGPINEYNRALEEQTRLLAFGAINAKQFDENVDKLHETLFQATHAGKSFEDGLARGLHSISAEVTDVSAQIENTLVNAFHGATEALVSFVTTGEIDFKKMVQSILADLTRLLLFQGLKALIGGAAGSSGGSSYMASLVSQSSGFLGFASGGEGRIGGSGGPDSQIFVARVTPGEHYRFTPPGQTPPSDRSAPQAPPQVNVYVVDNDKARMHEFMETDGEGYHHVFDRRAPDKAKRGRTTGR